ncbi:hypothetical protein HDR61_03085 [bacterium]|nr:hypothetical protein [bacterium]
MFSFENAIEIIPDNRTKGLFKEVYSSYCAGNYRSAIVMLWTVVICDILFKLNFLKDVYQDARAIQILEDVEAKRRINPKSPEWENTLIEKVCERTTFLGIADRQSIDFLQKNRHLCAHPVIENGELYQPTIERTRDLLRGALESILIKEPLLTKSISDIFYGDLENKKSTLGSFENLDSYLESRYFNNFNDPIVTYLLKGLWRFVIDPRNERELENQNVNAMALYSLLKHFEECCKTAIGQNGSLFGAAINQTSNNFGFLAVIEMCKRFSWLYPMLPDDVKLIIRNKILNVRELPDGEIDYPLARFVECWFLSENFEQHIENINGKLDTEYLAMKKLSPNAINKLYEMARFYDCIPKFVSLCTKIYSKSYSFNDADNRFSCCIRPYIGLFTKADCIELMRATNNNHINGNNQTCARNAAFIDHVDFLRDFLAKGGDREDVAEFDRWEPLLERLEA